MQIFECMAILENLFALYYCINTHQIQKFGNPLRFVLTK